MGKRTGHRTGRPSDYTPKLGAEICRRISEGETLKGICEDAHMPHTSTVLTWALGQISLALDGGFPAMYARARELRSELYADEIVEISDTEGDSAKARVRIDARKWVASKLLPRTYGEKLELSGPDGGPIPVESRRGFASAEEAREFLRKAGVKG